MSFKRGLTILLLLFLFLLPWQTRIVYAPAFLNSQFWEYGSGSWYATEVLLWVIIILSAVSHLRDKSFVAQIASREHLQKHWPRLVFSILVVAYFLWQMFRSVAPSISYQWLFRLLEGLCLFIILSEQTAEKRLLQTAFWLGGVGQGLLAMGQFFSQAVVHLPGFGLAPQTAARLGSFVVETAGERWLRAYGAFGSPNILGGYLALVFIIGLLLYLKSTPKQKVLFTAGQMLVLNGLILSFSRGAWVAAGVGVLGLLLVLYRARRGPFVFLDIGKQLAFSLLIILTLFFILRPLFTTRFTPGARLEERSLTERTAQYDDAWSLFRAHWLMGVGPGAYTAALFEKEHDRNVQPVHNVYLLLLAELGVIGFALFFGWCFFVGRHILRGGWQWAPVFITLLVLGLFDHWLVSLYAGTMVWWAVFGLALL